MTYSFYIYLIFFPFKILFIIFEDPHENHCCMAEAYSQNILFIIVYIVIIIIIIVIIIIIIKQSISHALPV